MQWRVPKKVPIVKILVAGIFVVLGLLLAQDTVGLVVAGLVTITLIIMALRDLITPIRLSVDHTGLTISQGYFGKRFLPWSSIEKVHTDIQHRLGMRKEFVEIDAEGNLYLFSSSELGAECDEVVANIQKLRNAATK